MKITEIRLILKNEDKLKAFANVTFDDALVIRGMKIISGNRGFFVSMPSKKRSDGTYQDIVHPVNSEMRQMIEEEVIQAYEREIAITSQAYAIEQGPAVAEYKIPGPKKNSSEVPDYKIRDSLVSEISSRESSISFKIESDEISKDNIIAIKSKLAEILSKYGADVIEFWEERGSYILKLFAKFKNNDDRSKFEKQMAIVLKEADKIIRNSYHSLNAKYLEKSILENQKLISDIRTAEERQLDKENRELQNELIGEQIAKMRIEKIQKFVELYSILHKLGDTEMSNWISGEILKLRGNTGKKKD